MVRHAAVRYPAADQPGFAGRVDDRQSDQVHDGTEPGYYADSCEVDVHT
ncbi:hypothetical protein ACFV9C_10050 [Kribbella sp. NPDC059898]